MMAIDASDADAAAVAARPAGPAPTMTMSKRCLSTGDNVHSVAGLDDAASLMGGAVDGRATFEANAHSAQRLPRLARDRSPKVLNAAIQQGGGDRCAFLDLDVDSVNCNDHAIVLAGE